MSITKSATWSEWYRNYDACGNAFDGMDISHLPDLMNYKGTFVIIINGKEYECSYYYPPQFFPDDFKAMGCKENPECPFEVTFFDYGFDLVWDPALGETITFSAYIPQETVTPPAVALPRVEKKMVEIVPEQSVARYGEVQGTFHIEDGKNYVVAWNGVKYNMTAKYNDSVNFSCIVLGNPQLVDDVEEAVDAPFCIAVYDYALQIQECEGDSETISLAIYEEQEVVKQIDPKFVGASGGSDPDIIFETAGSFNLANVNKDNITIVGGAEKVVEIIQKMQDGKFPKVVIRNAWKYGNYTCVDVYHGTRIFHNHSLGNVLFNFHDADYDVELIVNNEGVISSFTRTSRN